MAFRFEQSRITFALIAAWSAVIITSLFWNTYRTHQANVDKARIEARTLYEETVAFRGWSAFHGGVYVAVNDKIQPNPYLTVPDRDIITKDGRKFTLVNPAWMTRLVFERLSKQSAMPLINHITSLKYINPLNKPDEWEEKGLSAFERGAQEVSEEVVINNEPYLRLLKPLLTEEGCLKCHGHQGYKVGDVRGGMSLAVPLKPFFATALPDQRGIFATHGILWFIGMGGILAFMGSIQRKQQELAKSEENYRLLFESNPQPMWVYDLESLAFLTVNDAAVAHYGYSREEFLAMTIKDIRPPEDIPRLLQNIEGVTEGVDEAGVWRHHKKDGTVIYVEITSHTLIFKGRPAELVMATDVSERRKLEEQLRHAQKMEAVGRLAGGVAHDFNNILTAIIGYGSLTLMKTKADDPNRHHAEEIIAAAQRGANLTQGLLAFSRKQVINPRPVNINGIIERVGKLLVRLIGEDIKFDATLSNAELVVVADSGQIEQVLMNLAANARDSMPQGGVLHVETGQVLLDEKFIAAHRYGRAGAYALITMTDTGTGMDRMTAERIFEPFFTTKETGKGTGLGLSMVYGIIKQHEGYINVYTEPGMGTTFKIYLPLAVSSIPSEQPMRLQEPVRGRGETVLVAEDDVALRRLASSVLREFGYTVIEAIDGEDALVKLRQDKDRVQLLLLDVIMPKKNGREVYEEARLLKPSIKALFVSGYTADIVHKKGIIEEGQEFLSKPVAPGELLKKMREVLEK